MGIFRIAFVRQLFAIACYDIIYFHRCFCLYLFGQWNSRSSVQLHAQWFLEWKQICFSVPLPWPFPPLSSIAFQQWIRFRVIWINGCPAVSMQWPCQIAFSTRGWMSAAFYKYCLPALLRSRWSNGKTFSQTTVLSISIYNRSASGWNR